MRRFARSSWIVLALASLARAQVREIPPISAEIGAPSATGASATNSAIAPSVALSAGPSLAAPSLAAPSLAAPAIAPAPALAPALASPRALPFAAAASDGPLSYNPAVPAEAPAEKLSTDKPDPLRQLRVSLGERGDHETMALAEQLYYTDPMTGLPNRAYFVEKAEHDLAQVQDPTVAMLDMNNFGAVNVGLAQVHGVTKGRLRADGILAIAGAVLQELSRDAGVKVVRLGGEEFVALGSRDAVKKLLARAKTVMTPGRLLSAAGVVDGGLEMSAIAEAMMNAGRGDGPIGDFTYGVAETKGRSLDESIKAADHALVAAKDAGKRGVIALESDAEGGWAEWNPPAEMTAPYRQNLPRPTMRATAEMVRELESRLQKKEKAFFQEAAFKDPLTMTRSYDYVALKAAEWDKAYSRGGVVVLSSARNLKQINDILGHEAGDRYLHKLGIVLRQEISKARHQKKLDVQEAVRVASKEFLLVGRDASVVAELAAKEVEQRFNDGRMLTPEEVERLRHEVRVRGLVPADRVNLIGNLRVISEQIAADGGHADSKAALDRAFVRLEAQKREEDGTTTKVKLNFSAN